MKKIIAALSLVCLMATTSETASAQHHYRHRRHVRTTTYYTKHGWSRKGKDAAIGGAAGAVAGGLIGHGVKGAVIGGAAGATGGYLLGRHRDHKYGRRMDRHVVTTVTR